jgi:hypothetical protein
MCKKFSYLFFVVFMVFSLAGCEEEETISGPGDSTKQMMTRMMEIAPQVTQSLFPELKEVACTPLVDVVEMFMW